MNEIIRNELFDKLKFPASNLERKGILDMDLIGMSLIKILGTIDACYSALEKRIKLDD